MSIEDRIIEAIAAGEVLKVIYLGGSQPGTSRDITPISLDDGHVRALCLKSGKIQTFFMEKIALPDSNTEQNSNAGILQTPSFYSCMEDFVQAYAPFFKRLNWSVMHDKHSLSLHWIRKNGNPLKTPDVSIDYEEFAYDLVFDGENTIEQNHRKRSKPWTIRATGHNTKTVGDFQKVQIEIIKLAQEFVQKHG